MTSLSRAGVSHAEIAPAHLRAVYGTLIATKNTAQHLGDLLPDVPAAKHIDNAPVWGVIVETRRHPALAPVVSQFQDRLNIPVQLFHSAENREFVLGSSLQRRIAEGGISLTCLHQSGFSKKDYNALLLSQAFWRALLGRKKVLIFQTDTVLCANSEHSLEEFMGFDYIGATWNPRRPVGLVIHGGNGGLSLRDWHVSMECLRRFSPGLWPGGEDGYFAFHAEVIGGKVGGPHDCEPGFPIWLWYFYPSE